MRFLTVAPTAVLAACVVLGACSDDSSDSADGPPEEATEILETAGYINDDGTISIGPAGPDDPEVRAAMCDYLFGSPEQVSDRLGVDVTLAEGSGYNNLGGNGTGVSCTYDADGEPLFGLRMWGSDATETDSDAVVVEVPSGDSGFAQYHPDYDGETLDEDELVEWLEDAGTRWGGQSV